MADPLKSLFEEPRKFELQTAARMLFALVGFIAAGETPGVRHWQTALLLRWGGTFWHVFLVVIAAGVPGALIGAAIGWKVDRGASQRSLVRILRCGQILALMAFAIAIAFAVYILVESGGDWFFAASTFVLLALALSMFKPLTDKLGVLLKRAQRQ